MQECKTARLDCGCEANVNGKVSLCDLHSLHLEETNLAAGAETAMRELRSVAEPPKKSKTELYFDTPPPASLRERKKRPRKKRGF